MGSPYEMGRRRTGSVGVGIAVAVLVHAGLAASAALLARDTHSLAPGQRRLFELTAAKLVAKGDILPKKSMPHRDQGAPPPEHVQKVTPKSEPNPEPPKRQKRPKRPDIDPEDLMKDLGKYTGERRHIGRATPTVGDPEGVAGGTARDRVDGDIWAGKVRGYLKDRHEVPAFLTEDQLKALRARALIRFDAQGNILECKVIRRSPNGPFNESVAQVCRTTRTLPQPSDGTMRHTKGKIVVEFHKEE